MGPQLPEKVISIKDTDGLIYLVACGVEKKNSGELLDLEEAAIDLHGVKIIKVHVEGQVVLISQSRYLPIREYFLPDLMAGSTPGSPKNDEVRLILKTRLPAKNIKTIRRKNDSVVNHRYRLQYSDSAILRMGEQAELRSHKKDHQFHTAGQANLRPN
jgi:hypothetical protein